MKRIYVSAILVICTVICALLPGCVNKEKVESNVIDAESRNENEPILLTVLTEPTTWSQTYDLLGKDSPSEVTRNLQNIISYYESENPNVSIELEVMPKTTNERNYYITQKRVSLMAGKTPDIYLMPTVSTDEVNISKKERKDYEPLFRDVGQAQTNHWFADVSSYYDADQDLHTEELQQAIMNAGKVGDARYILPLGYSFDVLVTDKDLLSQEKLDAEKMCKSSLDLFGSLIDIGEARWLPDLYFGSLPLNYLPSLCDYNSEKVNLQEQDLTQLLEVLNKIYYPQIEYLLTLDQTKFGDWEMYLYDSKIEPYINETTPARIDSLSNIMKYLPTAKCSGKKLEVIPVTATDGSLCANITYWGAVGANCQNVKAAYDFLRTFLLPEVQYGEDLVGRKHYSTRFEHGIPGWPVRYKGFAEKRWNDIFASMESMEHPVESRWEKMRGTDISDEDLPVLDFPITSARFPSVLDQDLFEALSPLWDSPASDEDLKQMSADFVRNLKYHLAEG